MIQLISSKTSIDFLGKRNLALTLSAILIVISIASFFVRGLNFGIDFTGGTLVEVGYPDSIAIEEVRGSLAQSGYDDTLVQYFGSSSEIMLRVPTSFSSSNSQAVTISSQLMEILRTPYEEVLIDTGIAGKQQCIVNQVQQDCNVQMQRVEFVGPQVGEQLTEQGVEAMLYALIAIFLYVMFRFEFRFSLGAIMALIHDVVITVGFFSLFQLEFSLPVLAAVLAVIGYSLNDTIVVYDRIRENFRKIRKGTTVEILNISINRTLPRTILTSMTTLLVLGTLLLVGGETIRGFSLVLFIGVIVGTYSSIFIASPAVMILGIRREDLIPVKKEGVDLDPNP